MDNWKSRQNGIERAEPPALIGLGLSALGNIDDYRVFPVGLPLHDDLCRRQRNSAHPLRYSFTYHILGYIIDSALCRRWHSLVLLQFFGVAMRTVSASAALRPAS